LDYANAGEAHKYAERDFLKHDAPYG